MSTFVRMQTLANTFVAFLVATEGRRRTACKTRHMALASGIGPCGFARRLTAGSSNVFAASLPDRELNTPEGSNGIHTSTFRSALRSTDASMLHPVHSGSREREDGAISFLRASLRTSVLAATAWQRILTPILSP